MKSAGFSSLLFLLFFLARAQLSAQDHPAVTAQPNTVYVSAEGKFESRPRHGPDSIQRLGAG